MTRGLVRCAGQDPTPPPDPTEIEITGDAIPGGLLHAEVTNPVFFNLLHLGDRLFHEGDALRYVDLQWYVNGNPVFGANGYSFLLPDWVWDGDEITVGTSTGITSDPVYVVINDGDIPNT